MLVNLTVLSIFYITTRSIQKNFLFLSAPDI